MKQSQDDSQTAEHVQSATLEGGVVGKPPSGSVEEPKRGYLASRPAPGRRSAVGLGCLGLVLVWIAATLVLLAVIASSGNCMENGYDCHEAFDGVISWIDLIAATVLSILIIVLILRAISNRRNRKRMDRLRRNTIPWWEVPRDQRAK